MAIAKKLTASAIASSLMLAIAGPAFAADLSVEQVADKMFDLGIIVGNGTDLNLGGTLTRAELITTIVRSFGMEQSALLAKGAPSFNDVAATEWYSGWVAVAKNLAAQKGVELGVGNNAFNPNGQLSKVEALVFVMKFLGVKPATTSAIWYEAWINEAVAQGIVTEAQGADLMATADTKSTRGQAFVILDRGYSFKDANGKSLYTTHVDAQLPTLTLTPAAATDEAEITLSGSVADNKGVASVVINGEEAALTDGSFSHKLALKVGKNEVAVVVTDLAGNVLTKNYEITRNNVEAEKIEAADITVVAGATADVEAKLVDKNGAEIANAAITGTSDLGTFENGVFTAGTKAGAGTLTLKSGEITKTINVKVEAGELAKVQAAAAKPGVSTTLQAVDAHGNVVEGVTFSTTAAKAFISGNQFVATEAGSFEVKATKGETTVTGNIGVYGAATKLAISAPTKVIANGQTTFEVTVSALDGNGNLVSDLNAGSAGISSAFTGATTANFVNGKATFTLTAASSLKNSVVTINATSGVLTGASTTIQAEAQVATSISVSTPTDYVTTNDVVATTVTVDVLDQVGAKIANTDGVWEFEAALTGPATFTSGKDVKTEKKTLRSGDTFNIFPIEASAAGAISLNVSFPGLTAGSKSLTAAFSQGASKVVLTAPSATQLTAELATDKANRTVESTEYVQYSANITDKYNVPVYAAANVGIVVEGADAADLANYFVATSVDGKNFGDYVVASANSLKTVATNNKGQVWFRVAGQKAKSATVKVTSGSLTESAKSTFTVVAADAFSVKIGDSAQTLRVLRTDATKATVTAKVYDRFGNAVSKAGVKAVFHASTFDGVKLNGAAADAEVLTDANGVATVEVSLAKYAESAEISLVSVANGLTAAGANITVAQENTLPASASVEIVDNTGLVAPSVVKSGYNDVRFRVRVTDNEGRNVGADFLTNYGFTVKASSSTVDTTGLTWKHEGNGVFVTNNAVTVKTAENVTFTVSVNNIASTVSSARNLTVIADTVAKLAQVAGTTKTADNAYNLEVDPSSVKAITINLADVNGNAINAGYLTTGTTINFTVSNGVEIRNENGLTLPTVSNDGTISVEAGRSSVTVYVVAPAADINGVQQGSFILQVNGGTAQTITLK